MSINQMLLALKAKTGSSARKLVLLKLADNSNDEGVCFPSHQNIADHCEMTKRSVITHINRLEADGFLTKTHRKTQKGNSSNNYQLSISPPSENISPPSENISPPSENISPTPSENISPRTSHLSKPVNEPKEKAGFIKPTQEEVSAYACSNKLNVSGFFDYYESNGWKVGKNKMQNWKAAASGWSGRQKGYNNGNGQNNNRKNAAETMHDTLKQIAAEADEREMGERVV